MKLIVGTTKRNATYKNSNQKKKTKQKTTTAFGSIKHLLLIVIKQQQEFQWLYGDAIGCYHASIQLLPR